MKKLLFLLMFTLGIVGISNAKTELSIEMFGRTYTTTLDQDLNLPNGETVYMPPSSESATMSFTFPVHWHVGGRSGSFPISGDEGTTLQDIINTLIDMFW